MDVNKMIGMVVGVMVGVLVLSAALFPVIDSATTTERTFENKTSALYYVDEITADSPDYTMTYTAGSSKLVINNVEVSRTNGTILCDLGEYLIRDRGSSIQWVSPTGNLTLGDATTGFTLTLIGGALTVIRTTTATPLELTVTSGYAIFPDGDFVMKAPAQNAYVLKDSPITAMGTTTINGEWRTLFQITGTVDDIEVVNLNDTYDIENVVIDYAAVPGYIDLFTINKVTFDAVNKEDSTITQSCTYNYFIVPAEVTAEFAVHASQDEINLLETIPILITVGLILGIVGAVFVRRLE